MAHDDTHRELHRMFNERDFDGMKTHLSESMEYEDLPRGLTMNNRNDVVDWLQGWPAAFSDARIEQATYVCGPDFSFARFQARGRNDGAFGPLPPTNAEMDCPFFELVRYDADGRAISVATLYDQLTMLTQLGHMQPAG